MRGAVRAVTWAACALFIGSVVGASAPAASVVGGSAPAASDPVSVRQLLAQLPVAPERNAGYKRDYFRHWSDLDGDGCDTRREVLRRDSEIPVTITGRCRIVLGRWYSPYDGGRSSDPATFDIDHVVPLAEAWGSGAWRWSAVTREAFANDLGSPSSLIAVTASSNRSKSDRDPAEWLPAATDTCRYLSDWVVTKWRWRLRIDPIERAVLVSALGNCPDRRVQVVRAVIVNGPDAGPGAPDAGPTAPDAGPTAPDAAPSVVRYPNCAAARAAGVTPIRQAEAPALYAANQHMDRDKDGVACE